MPRGKMGLKQREKTHRHLQAEERVLRRNQPCWCLLRGYPASRSVREWMPVPWRPHLWHFLMVAPANCLLINCHVSVVSSDLWQFLSPSWFLMTLVVWGSPAQTFCRMSLSAGFSNLFLCLHWGCGLWKKCHIGEVSFWSHHPRGSMLSLVTSAFVTWPW